jgi:hypothetical protein
VCFRLAPPDHTRKDVLPVIIIWLQPGVHVSTLVHEAWHAAFWVLRRRGVDFASDDLAHEPMAYYLDWIVRRATGAHLR